MNSNTIIGYRGGTGRNQIASQTLASTTETEFVVNNDSGTSVAVLQLPQQGDIRGSASPLESAVNPALLYDQNGRTSPSRGVSAPWFHSGSFDNGRPFLVHIHGVATPASNAGNTLAIKLYLGATKAGTNIATTGAVPQATTTTAKHFIVEASLQWDSVSQSTRGQFWFDLDGTSGTRYATWGALTNAGSGTTLPNMKFCASATWGNAAGGVVAVDEFTIEQY